MADCLFCRIANGEIPAKQVYEDERAVAFADINPQAPFHLLVVPRAHMASLAVMNQAHADLLGHLFWVVAHLASLEPQAKAGYRTVINTGQAAGQTVHHLHVHLLAGRNFTWPPG